MTGERDLRNRELALIHLGAKEVGLDEDAYRDMLRAVTGHDSAATLDREGRARVIAHLRRSGFTPRQAGGERYRPLGESGFEIEANGEPDAAAIIAAADPFLLVRATHRVLDGEKKQEALIRALWDSLIAIGVMRHGAFARMDTYLHRQGCAVSHPRFLSSGQAGKIIEGLKGWLRRECLKRRAAGNGR